jgi:hypothetical protein
VDPSGTIDLKREVFSPLGYLSVRLVVSGVCAFAREALLKTVRMAEERGFKVVHGIVDSGLRS